MSMRGEGADGIARDAQLSPQLLSEEMVDPLDEGSGAQGELSHFPPPALVWPRGLCILLRQGPSRTYLQIQVQGGHT